MSDEKQIWKVGDWCFYEFQLSVIEAVDPERGVTSVSTTYVSCGGHDIFCMPLSKDAKRWSDHVKYVKDEVRQAAGSMNLNWPDLHRAFVQMWIDGAEHFANRDAMQAKYDKVTTFGNEIRESIKSARHAEVGGVRLMR